MTYLKNELKDIAKTMILNRDKNQGESWSNDTDEIADIMADFYLHLKDMEARAKILDELTREAQELGFYG